MGTKELNCDWLGLAPENAKFRLLTDTLLTLSGPISMPRVSLLDSAGTGSGEGPEINDLEETLLKYEFRVSQDWHDHAIPMFTNILSMKDGQPVWIKIDSGFWVRGHISGKQRNRRQIARTVSVALSSVVSYSPGVAYLRSVLACGPGQFETRLVLARQWRHQTRHT